MFKQGCYITTVFADGWADHDDTCFKKQGDAVKARRRLVGVFPDAQVHVVRAGSREELDRKRQALSICKARVPRGEPPS